MTKLTSKLSDQKDETSFRKELISVMQSIIIPHTGITKTTFKQRLQVKQVFLTHSEVLFMPVTGLCSVILFQWLF